jgi:hypothetical protein
VITVEVTLELVPRASFLYDGNRRQSQVAEAAKNELELLYGKVVAAAHLKRVHETILL